MNISEKTLKKIERQFFTMIDCCSEQMPKKHIKHMFKDAIIEVLLEELEEVKGKLQE